MYSFTSGGPDDLNIPKLQKQKYSTGIYSKHLLISKIKRKIKFVHRCNLLNFASEKLINKQIPFIS